VKHPREAGKRKQRMRELTRDRVLADRDPIECPTPHKVPYVSRKVARTRLASAPRKTGEKLRIYKCSCGAYHIGKEFTPSRAIAREIGSRKTAQKKGGP
jgi:hypothetical protein